MTDKLELHIIELTKLENIKNKTKEEEELLEWCKFIKSPDQAEETIMSKNEGIKRAKEELDKISQDEHERWLAEMREKAIRDEMAIRDSGYNEGIEEGLQQGEKNKAKEIAKSMLKDNLSVEMISKYTGLSLEDIEGLK